MGQVFLAHDTWLDRLVALKFIATLDANLHAWLAHEARAIARINHPNIVRIHRIASVQGHPYLVYEYIRGETLEKLLAKNKERRQRFSKERIRNIARDIAYGLSAAHECDVLHRDIKPANVILTEQGEAKLLDFGLAQIAEEALPNAVLAERADRSPLTSHDKHKTLQLNVTPPREQLGGVAEHITLPSQADQRRVIGSPGYMCAELWCGKAATVQTDIYAFGVLLFELATGHVPYDGNTVEELKNAALAGCAPLVRTLAPELGPEFSALIDRCMALEPSQRFASAWAIYSAIENLHTQDDPASLPERNPFPGLTPFEVEDRGLFFGRQGPIGTLIGRLSYSSMVLVTGDSGVGKSSLCRAGVLPLVQQRRLGDGRAWEIVTFTPGQRPLRNLASVLASALNAETQDIEQQLRDNPDNFGQVLQRQLGRTRGLFVFVDQLEELVTQSDQTEAHLFGRLIGELTEYQSSLRILMTVRSDFLSRLAEVIERPNVLSKAVYILPPLSARELREIIILPAHSKGVSFESEAMVETLVQTTLKAAGGLPLLQFTLAALWDARPADSLVIPANALNMIGGVAGALANHAERVLASLSSESEHDAAKQILLQLATQDGTRLSRSPTELLAGNPAAVTAFNCLVDGRLVVVRDSKGEGTVCELAHEALISGWSTLQGWLSGDIERHKIRQSIENSSREWERAQRAQDMLLSARRLAEVERLGLQLTIFSHLANEFLSASVRNLRWSRHRSHIFRFFLIAVPILAVLVTGWIWQGSRAMAEAQRAVDALNMARVPGRELEALVASIKLVGARPRGAKPPPALADAALTESVMNGGEIVPPLKHGSNVRALALSPDGRLLLSGTDDGKVRLWSVQTGQQIALLAEHQASAVAVAITPDANQLLTVGADGKACRWASQAPKLLSCVRGPGSSIRDASFSPDGTLVVMVGASGQVWRMSVQDGHWQQMLAGHAGKVNSARFSPDGKLVATAGDDETARIFSVSDGLELFALKGHKGAVLQAVFSVDGRQLATSGVDKTVRLWRTTDGQAHAILSGLKDHVHTLAFSPDGLRLLTIARNMIAAQLWDLKQQTPIALLLGHSSPVLSAVFSPDGTRIVTTGSSDADVRMFNGHNGNPIANLKGHQGVVTAAVFSPDGLLVVTASQDGSARIWSAYPGRALTTFTGHTDKVWVVRFSPDGSRLVSASGDGTARLWDVRRQSQVAILTGHTKLVNDVNFSPDGSRVITASWDGTARIWDTRTGQTIQVLRGHSGQVDVATFSRDGSLAATAGSDSTVRLWDGVTGDLRGILTGHAAETRITGLGFSPDSSRLVSAGWDGTARIWDVKSGAEIHRLAVAEDALQMWFATFSPDGRLVATAGQSNTARLWFADSGQQKHALHGHTLSVNAAAFSPDGQRLVTASLDSSAMIWDTETGARLASLVGHSDTVWTASFSPDQTRIVTASNDHTARLWDALTGEPRGGLRGHSSGINNAVFSPDGRLVATSSLDYTVKLFPATTEQIFSIACNRLHPWDVFQQVQHLCSMYLQ